MRRSLFLLLTAAAIVGWFALRRESVLPRAPNQVIRETEAEAEVDSVGRRDSRPAEEPAVEGRKERSAAGDVDETATVPEGSSPATLRVRVTDTDGRRCEGARVSTSIQVGQDELREIGDVTDAAGECVLRDLPATVRVIGVAVGSYRRTVPVTLVPGGWTDRQVVMPKRSGRIVGQVRHVVQGPLGGVTVVTSPRRNEMNDELRAVTGVDGWYTLEPVPPGTYAMTLFSGGREFQSLRDFATVELKEDETVRRDFEVGGVTLRGTVREAATNAPLSGATVRILQPVQGPWAESNTGSTGGFRIDELTTGPYRLAIAKPGYATSYQKLDLVPGQGAVEFRLQRGPIVHIEVHDPDGRPVTGDVTLVWARDDDESRGSEVLSLDASGHGTVNAIAPGRYGLTAYRWSQGGFLTQSVRAVIGEGESTVRLVATRTTTGNLALHGCVRDAVTSEPIVGVAVEIGGGAFTDEHGMYAIRQLPPGAYRVRAWKDGYGEVQLQDVVVETGGRQLDLTMEPASPVTLRLRDASGAPVSGEVELLYVTETSGVRTGAGVSLHADDAGRASFARLLPGRYRITLKVAGRGGAELRTTIGPGENVLDVEIRSR